MDGNWDTMGEEGAEEVDSAGRPTDRATDEATRDTPPSRRIGKMKGVALPVLILLLTQAQSLVAFADLFTHGRLPPSVAQAGAGPAWALQQVGAMQTLAPLFRPLSTAILWLGGQAGSPSMGYFMVLLFTGASLAYGARRGPWFVTSLMVLAALVFNVSAANVWATDYAARAFDARLGFDRDAWRRHLAKAESLSYDPSITNELLVEQRGSSCDKARLHFRIHAIVKLEEEVQFYELFNRGKVGEAQKYARTKCRDDLARKARLTRARTHVRQGRLKAAITIYLTLGHKDKAAQIAHAHIKQLEARGSLEEALRQANHHRLVDAAARIRVAQQVSRSSGLPPRIEWTKLKEAAISGHLEALKGRLRALIAQSKGDSLQHKALQAAVARYLLTDTSLWTFHLRRLTREGRLLCHRHPPRRLRKVAQGRFQWAGELLVASGRDGEAKRALTQWGKALYSAGDRAAGIRLLARSRDAAHIGKVFAAAAHKVMSARSSLGARARCARRLAKDHQAVLLQTSKHLKKNQIRAAWERFASDVQQVDSPARVMARLRRKERYQLWKSMERLKERARQRPALLNRVGKMRKRIHGLMDQAERWDLLAADMALKAHLQAGDEAKIVKAAALLVRKHVALDACARTRKLFRHPRLKGLVESIATKMEASVLDSGLLTLARLDHHRRQGKKVEHPLMLHPIFDPGRFNLEAWITRCPAPFEVTISTAAGVRVLAMANASPARSRKGKEGSRDRAANADLDNMEPYRSSSFGKLEYLPLEEKIRFTAKDPGVYLVFRAVPQRPVRRTMLRLALYWGKTKVKEFRYFLQNNKPDRKITFSGYIMIPLKVPILLTGSYQVKAWLGDRRLPSTAFTISRD